MPGVIASPGVSNCYAGGIESVRFGVRSIRNPFTRLAVAVVRMPSAAGYLFVI